MKQWILVLKSKSPKPLSLVICIKLSKVILKLFKKHYPKGNCSKHTNFLLSCLDNSFNKGQQG